MTNSKGASGTTGVLEPFVGGAEDVFVNVDLPAVAELDGQVAVFSIVVPANSHKVSRCSLGLWLDVRTLRCPSCVVPVGCFKSMNCPKEAQCGRRLSDAVNIKGTALLYWRRNLTRNGLRCESTCISM